MQRTFKRSHQGRAAEEHDAHRTLLLAELAFVFGQLLVMGFQEVRYRFQLFVHDGFKFLAKFLTVEWIVHGPSLPDFRHRVFVVTANRNGRPKAALLSNEISLLRHYGQLCVAVMLVPFS